jgi:hypothetical protein
MLANGIFAVRNRRAAKCVVPPHPAVGAASLQQLVAKQLNVEITLEYQSRMGVFGGSGSGPDFLIRTTQIWPHLRPFCFAGAARGVNS